MLSHSLAYTQTGDVMPTDNEWSMNNLLQNDAASKLYIIL